MNVNLINEELKNSKLSIKIHLILILKLTYFSNAFNVTFTLKLNLPSSCIIRCESEFVSLWNKTGIL